MSQVATSQAMAKRFVWLAIVVAVLTIAPKFVAYLLTDSVGLLSDALESIVNLVAAIAALVALTIAQQEPDVEHAYGHSKAEYFSSGFEGLLIIVAAATIAATAIPRLFSPVPLEGVGAGMIVSVVASVINLVVAIVLLRAGRRYRSITLEADGRHLMTDFWTTVGVLVAVAAVSATGWNRLDPIVALIVAANILWTGYGLIRRSVLGLLDTAIPDDELAIVKAVLERYHEPGKVETHALRTRQAAARRFISVHVLVPNEWSVDRGHSMAESIARSVRTELPGASVFTHLEPIGNPASWADEGLDLDP